MTFGEAYEIAKPFTIVTPERCELLWSLAHFEAPSDGDFAEVGVYRGGSAMLLRMASTPERQIHLFDTFSGHPDVAGEFDTDRHPSGRFADTDALEVTKRVGGNLAVWIGRFPGTIIHGFGWTRPLALVHIDVDLYRSTRDVCALLVPLLVPGGIAICDDYDDEDCPGARRAVDEWVSCNPGVVDLTVASTGQALLRKRE